MKLAALAFLMIPLLGSCAEIAKIPDDQLAQDLYIGAKQAIQFALRTALKKATPETLQTITADVKLGNSIIKAEILPLLQGASTKELLRGALDMSLANLWAKIKPELRDAVQLSLSLLISGIELPKNPTDQLNERTKKALVGLFTGISEGADAVLVVPAPPPPPATDAGFKLDK